MGDKLNAISLFSGIGGFELGIGDYCRTVLYCEADPHAQAVLFSRMAEGAIDYAPICTDVREITGEHIDIPIDIVFGGFPCQDISCAGKGVGLWGESEAYFFSRSCAWPKKSSPRSYSLKTSAQSEHGDWTELSKKLPKSGMTVDGVCYPLQTLELTTKENDGSVWLGTPRATEAIRTERFRKGRLPSPEEFVQMWPTPNNRDWKGERRKLTEENPTKGITYGMDLTQAVKMWPTPAASESGRTLEQFEENKTRGTKLGGMGLSIAVQKWPTPTVDDATVYRGNGALNPTWVEWLMGFPLLWSKACPTILREITGKKNRKISHELPKKKNSELSA